MAHHVIDVTLKPGNYTNPWDVTNVKGRVMRDTMVSPLSIPESRQPSRGGVAAEQAGA
jgi:hypothetical protein